MPQPRVRTQNRMIIFGECKKKQTEALQAQGDFRELRKYAKFQNRNKIESEIVWGVYLHNFCFAAVVVVGLNSTFTYASRTRDFGPERNFGFAKLKEVGNCFNGGNR